MDPNNKAALNQITLCNQFLKDYSQKEKKLYANMFTKFATVDNEVIIHIIYFLIALRCYKFYYSDIEISSVKILLTLIFFIHKSPT